MPRTINVIRIIIGLAWLASLAVVPTTTPEEMDSKIWLWVHAPRVRCGTVIACLLILATFIHEQISKWFHKKTAPTGPAADYFWGNIYVSSLHLPTPFASAFDAVHRAAFQAGWLKNAFFDKTFRNNWIALFEQKPVVPTSDTVLTLKKAMEKLTFSDLPLARKALSMVESKLIDARDNKPEFDGQKYECAHTAALQFAEYVQSAINLHHREISFNGKRRLKATHQRLRGIPPIDATATVEAMKREAIAAAKDSPSIFQTERLDNINKAKELFDGWSTARNSLDFMDAYVAIQHKIAVTIKTNDLLIKLPDAINPLLALGEHFGVDMDLLTMVCTNTERFVYPGGNRGNAGDRKRMLRSLNEILGKLQN
jgi:hypothetical protein